MMDDLISRKAAIDAINALHDKPNAWLDCAVDAVRALPPAQPEVVKDIDVPCNDIISRQAVMALDMFTKIFCRDYAVQGDLAFRCNQCEFEMSNGKCLMKVMARKIYPDYKDFGSMGDL